MSQIIPHATTVDARIHDLQRIALCITNEMMPRAGTQNERDGLKERLLEIAFKIQSIKDGVA